MEDDFLFYRIAVNLNREILFSSQMRAFSILVSRKREQGWHAVWSTTQRSEALSFD